MAVWNALRSCALEVSRDSMLVKVEWKRFHNLRDLGPFLFGVEGLRSHRRGIARRALMGVKLKELSGMGSGGALGRLEERKY